LRPDLRPPGAVNLCQPCPDFKGIETREELEARSERAVANHALISKGLRLLVATWYTAM